MAQLPVSHYRRTQRDAVWQSMHDLNPGGTADIDMQSATDANATQLIQGLGDDVDTDDLAEAQAFSKTVVGPWLCQDMGIVPDHATLDRDGAARLTAVQDERLIDATQNVPASDYVLEIKDWSVNRGASHVLQS